MTHAQIGNDVSIRFSDHCFLLVCLLCAVHKLYMRFSSFGKGGMSISTVRERARPEMTSTVDRATMDFC
jgi:hypothetical protein